MLKSVLVRLVLRIAYRSLDELTIEGVRYPDTLRCWGALYRIPQYHTHALRHLADEARLRSDSTHGSVHGPGTNSVTLNR